MIGEEWYFRLRIRVSAYPLHNILLSHVVDRSLAFLSIFCCVLHRQHNNPERFLKYTDDKIEFFTSKGNPLFVRTDSNIGLLRINSCNYVHDFLLSLLII